MFNICMECNNSFSQDKLIICGKDFLWHCNKKNGFLCPCCLENIEAYGSSITIVYNYKLYKLKFFKGYVYDMEYNNNCINEIKDELILRAINEIALNQSLNRIDNWRGIYNTHSSLLKKLKEMPIFINSHETASYYILNTKLIRLCNKLGIPLIIISNRTSNTCYNIIEYYTMKDLGKKGENYIKNIKKSF